MARSYFEDLQAGETASYGDYPVSHDGILAFARDHDPDLQARPKDAAQGAASGWLVAGLNMRMIYDAFIADLASLGGPGLDALDWLAPVHAGDRLSGRRTILDLRVSQSRPEMGLVRVRTEVFNQHAQAVMRQRNVIMVLRRGAAERPGHAAAGENAATTAAVSSDPASPLIPPPSFEDLALGTTSELGAVHFSRDDLIVFARAYDPQPFHIDDEAARRSHFGRLAASGWQTAAGWSKAARLHHVQTHGETPPMRGPLLSITALNWRRPVTAGDTISYASRIEAKRPTDEPGWALSTRSTQAPIRREPWSSIFAARICGKWRPPHKASTAQVATPLSKLALPSRRTAEFPDRRFHVIDGDQPRANVAGA